MSAEDLVETTADHQEPKNLIRSQYKDIMVKIDEDIYHLDRLQLALKSGYFEKLFIDDFTDKNRDLIEIPVMDTDTFSAVVDIIYGEKLDSVTNADNYVSLLMAMDYLQMEIDAKIYKHVVNVQLFRNPPPNDSVFKLYHFLADNANYKYLLLVVLQSLSRNLEDLQDLDEFLTIPCDHFITIISGPNSYESFTDNIKKLEVTKICAKWICHDLENRLPHTIDLANAAKFRFGYPHKIPREDVKNQLPTINEQLNHDIVAKYFGELLMGNGAICFSCDGSSELDSDEDEKCENRRSECASDNSSLDGFLSNRGPKLEKFLRNSNLYDITVKAGDKMYKLHRSVLKSASSYFEEIFSIEYSELITQCEGIPTLPSKDKVYFVDEIDSTIFDMMVHHMYVGKVKFTSDIIVRLFKAAHMLRIDSLLEPCHSWMEAHYEDLGPGNVIEIINFTRENDDYDHLNRVFSSKCILESWPEIDNLPQFATFFEAINLREETDQSDEHEVYLVDKVDQETFGLIINYIYFDEVELSNCNIMRLLKASEILKVGKLMKECAYWLLEWPTSNDLSSLEVFEVLSFAGRNIEYEALNIIYLAKYMIEWPEVDDSIFHWISYDWLMNMLMSPYFRFDDPRKILDICSKWVIQDMENRYCLIPRIALAISRNRTVDCDNYCIASPSDFNHCTQDFVKDKLWEVLSSTCVLSSAVLCKNKMERPQTEQPSFIAWEMSIRKFIILNDEWDEIASFRFVRRIGLFEYTYMSATMINDHLFILLFINRIPFFHVYNFSLKKFIYLATNSQIYKERDHEMLKYTLLSCCNEIYCCFEDGEILKYSFELNHWSTFSKSEPDKNRIFFKSDGNTLYRRYRYMVSQTDSFDYTRTRRFVSEAYNFEQNSWVSSLNSSSLFDTFPACQPKKPPYKYFTAIHKLTIS